MGYVHRTLQRATILLLAFGGLAPVYSQSDVGSNSSIVFLSPRDHATEGRDIFLLSAAGIRRLTSGLVWMPSPSVSGKKIVFRPNDGHLGLLQLDVESGVVEPLLGDGFESYPSMSSDERWLLFSDEDSSGPGCPTAPGTEHDWAPEGCNYLFIADLERGGHRRLADDPGKMYQASFSADGSMIAFVRRGQGGTQEFGDLEVMNADGSGRRLLVRLPVGRQVSWSPDGENILFSKEDDLWTVDIQSGELTQITNTSFRERFPTYSPGGRLIAFVGTEESLSEADIWTMSLAGERRQNLTEHPARYSDVRWIGVLDDLSAVMPHSWGQVKSEHADPEN